MTNTGCRQRLHTGEASLFAEVPCVVVRETHDVEARVDEMMHVTRWRAKQVTGGGVAAFFPRFAVIEKHAFEIAESHVGVAKYRRYVPQETDAVVIGEVVLRVIGAEHHVADGRDAQTQCSEVPGGSHDGRRIR